MGEGTANRSNREWLDSVYDKLKVKLKAECRRVGTDIPYTTGEDGRYRDIIDTAYGRTPDGGVTLANWTNGFWPGMLWQMYHATGDTAYRYAAAGVEERLEAVLKDSESVGHDLGFLFLQSSVANYRETGDKEAKRRGLLAAAELAARYNLKGEFLRAWSGPRETEHGKRMGGGDIRGWMIIDSMMNLPLLYWASRELDDPRFSQIAVSHAKTVQRYIVRPDGSCNHIVALDPDTGEYLNNPAGQGYGQGSSWSRGQSWALYGFALAYRHTRDESFLTTAKRDGDGGPVTWLQGSENVTANETVRALLEDIRALVFSRCVDYDPSDEALTICGFDTPPAALTVNYTTDTGTEETISLTIGAQVLDGSGRYARLGDSTTIYSLPTAALDPLMRVAANGLDIT